MQWTDFIIGGNTGYTHVINQFPQPGNIKKVDPAFMPGINKQIFGSILLMGVTIRQSRHPQFSHASGTGIRTHRKKSHPDIGKIIIPYEGLSIPDM